MFDSKRGPWSHRPLRLQFESLEFKRVLAAFVVTSGADSGVGSLREAIQAANATPGADLIQFDAAIPGFQIQLASELTITDSVTLDAFDLPLQLDIDTTAADPTPAVNDGGGIRALVVDDGDSLGTISVELNNLRFLGGDVTGSGGAILSRESLTLNDVVFAANHATESGGALYQSAEAAASFDLINSNRDRQRGGGRRRRAVCRSAQRQCSGNRGELFQLQQRLVRAEAPDFLMWEVRQR